tara:strand:+ start:485 stop:1399 length:915 start_codon:yes stop_codon:yes gene_type:complete
MIPTIFALYKHFNGEEGYEYYNAYALDLFGVLNWGPNYKNKEEIDDNINMFYGLYKGLYNYGVSAKEIYRCYLSNRLDELIHTKYSLPWLEPGVWASGYYKKFCEKNLVIGETFQRDTSDQSDEESNEESDEETEPYIYKNIPTLYHLEDKHLNVFRQTVFRQTKETDIIMQDKINSYKQQDRKKGRNFNDEEYCDIETIKKLIEKQDSKCYVCGDILIFSGYTPFCLYQFTLDRNNENLPHTKNNVLLCCYYCNCRDYCKNHDEDKNTWEHKMCKNGCHTTKRTITRTRQNINDEEISKLLIK